MFLYSCGHTTSEEDMRSLKKRELPKIGQNINKATHVMLPRTPSWGHWKRARVGWAVQKYTQIAVFDVTRFTKSGKERIANPIYSGSQTRKYDRAVLPFLGREKRSGLKDKEVYFLARNPMRKRK